MSEQWGYWPFSNCHARAVDKWNIYSCDLKRNHKGDHMAERGMYWITWSTLTSACSGPVEGGADE